MIENIFLLERKKEKIKKAEIIWANRYIKNPPERSGIILLSDLWSEDRKTERKWPRSKWRSLSRRPRFGGKPSDRASRYRKWVLGCATQCWSNSVRHPNVHRWLHYLWQNISLDESVWRRQSPAHISRPYLQGSVLKRHSVMSRTQLSRSRRRTLESPRC